MPTVNITIDDVRCEVDNRLTVIEAARQFGVKIPHFCWHPTLSVSGNCRMCLVEVEKMPKLVIACSTQVVEEMIIRTKSDRVLGARKAVMEFILINHPLDCPICDEAGECKLQEYAYKHSAGVSRFTEDKVHKPKRVEVGPRVMLDAERCILCSRCVRFCEEIVGQHQLQFIERGDKTTLTTFPGEQLDNPYSMNVVDICPVGALTNRDFRFKARVWEMSFTDSICQGCARGCNIEVGVRNNEILRLTPRTNEAVNSYWMCDHGRLETFKQVNADDRIKAPMIKKDGRLAEVGWDEAIARVVSELRSYKKSEIAAIGSPFETNEDNYVFQKFVKDVLGIRNLEVVPHEISGDEDALLIRADKTPNAAGAREVGAGVMKDGLALEGILAGIREGRIKALYSLDSNIAAIPEIAEALGKLDFFVVHATNDNATVRMADVVLAASTYAEKNGTIVNFQRRVQRIRPAVTTLEQERAFDGFEMSRWDKFAAHNDRWGKGPRRDARPSWKIITAVAALMGTKMKHTSAADIFQEITQKVESFRGLSYLSLGVKGFELKSTHS